MTNDTDLANHALALISEAEISAITDASSPLQMYEALDVVRRSVLKNMRTA